MTTVTAGERIDQFLEDILKKGSSGNTIAAYRGDLERLKNFLWGQRSCTGWETVTREDIKLYIEDMRGRHHENSSISRRISAVKSFFRFLDGTGVLKGNPIEGLASPKASKPLPKTLSREQVDLLLDQPAKKSTPVAIRDTAMLELLYATGLRVTELVSLDLDNLSIDRKNQYVRVNRKNHQHRFVPLHRQAVGVLVRYLNKGRPILSKTKRERALFLNRRGERLTRQSLWLILKQYAKEAGINELVTPHTLRHSFATHMLRGGASVEIVQELLGHSNISTTQVYARITSTGNRKVIEEAHPRVCC